MDLGTPKIGILLLVQSNGGAKKQSCLPAAPQQWGAKKQSCLPAAPQQWEAKKQSCLPELHSNGGLKSSPVSQSSTAMGG